MIYCPNHKSHPQMTIEMCQARIERGDPRCRIRKGKGYACPVADKLIAEMKKKQKELDVMTNKVTRQVAEVVEQCGRDERCAVAYLLGQAETLEKDLRQQIKRLEEENKRLRETVRDMRPSWA
jgi:phosphoglycolate phosphatase-like HAD superfamily hydrolase